MKKLYAVIALAGVLIAPSLYAQYAGFGGTAVLGGGGNNGGGPFSAVTTGGTNPESFTTFCLSIETYFQLGVPYSYQVSSTIDANEPIQGYDYVTVATAYIYHEYLTGNTSFTSNPNAVQSTIWYEQGLLTGQTDPENGANLAGDISTILPLLPPTYDSSAPANGLFGIEVMNMEPGYAGATYAQPQLIPIPEPTTIISGALLLLPFGASTLRILRRNRGA